MKSADGRECSSFVCHKEILLTGKRTTKLYLLNPEERKVEKIEVDGCAITDGPRCDWLVLVSDRQPHNGIYVELKSSDILHAIEQLEETMTQIPKNRARLTKRCLVVLNRCPMTGTDVQKQKDRFRKKFSATFDTVRNGGKVAL